MAFSSSQYTSSLTSSKAFSYRDCFEKKLENLHHEKRYRVFRPLEKSVTHFPKAVFHASHKKEVTLWSTNDYLGLGTRENAIQALCEQAKQSGVGSGGTRNISGTHPLHLELEAVLAQLHEKESALLFNSGYAANTWTLYTLGRALPQCMIFSDASNHASMIMGIRASGAEKYIFKHNDREHLHTLLKQADPKRPKIIAVESVYSMDGDFAPLEDFCEMAKTYNALLYVDEVHAVGLYGETGAGLAEAKGLNHDISLIQGTLAKGFGTLGGYIAGDGVMIDVIRSCAPGFIFSTTLPSPLLAATLSNIRYSIKTPQIRQDFWKTVAATRKALQQKNIAFEHTPSHILLLVIGDARRCEAMAMKLLNEFNIYIQPINYPTVPKGSERFRMTPTRHHTPQMIADLSEALETVLRDKSL